MLTTASRNHLVLSQQRSARLRKWTVAREAGRFLMHSALRLVRPDARTIWFLKLCLEKRNAAFLERDSQCVLRNRGGVKSDACWQEVCHETKARWKNITKKAYIEATWKSFGKTAVLATISLQSSAMEHKYPAVISSCTPLLEAWWRKWQRETFSSNMISLSHSTREHWQW